MSSVPAEILEQRRRTGADRWDEMWDGVLHMGPSPGSEQQDFEGALEAYLRSRWARPRGSLVFHTLNISRGGDWTRDYRIPDLILLKPGCAAIVRQDFVEGPPLRRRRDSQPG